MGYKCNTSSLLGDNINPGQSRSLGLSLSDQIKKDFPDPLSKVQKLSILSTLITIIIISHWPGLLGWLVLIDKGRSKNDFLLFLVVPCLMYTLMFICPIFIAKVKPLLADFDKTWFRKTHSEFKKFLWVPLSIFVSSAVINLLAKHLGLPFTKPIHRLCSDRSVISFIIPFVFYVLVGPVVEEIFWRGYVQYNLAKVFGHRIALFTQAIAFGLLHVDTIVSCFSGFVAGLIFGIWRQRRKTLLPIIVMHIIINSLIYVSVLLHIKQLR